MIGGFSYNSGGSSSVTLYDHMIYVPATNSWQEVLFFPGTPRTLAMAFSLNGKVFYGCGYAVNNTYYSDLWQFDPATTTWTQKADFGGGLRANPSSFVIGNFAYAGIGTGYQNDLWSYQGDGTGTCTTDLDLIFQTDGVSNINWELREQGTNALMQSGGGVYPQSDGYSVSTCLPDGDFYLMVSDGEGNGITGGGYILKVDGGARIIDDRNNFLAGTTSQIANGEGFHIPLGGDRMIFTSCDKLDWRNNEFMVTNDNAMVNAQYGVNNATSGYQIWWYDPNGGYSFRRFQSHNTANGLPAGPTRACHFRVNGWIGNQLQPDVLYNVKVRSRINGTFGQFGPACRFMLDPVRAQCPLTQLMDIPNNAFFSCGATRSAGTGQPGLVHARPVTRLNNNNAVVNANRYQFRFRLPAENFSLVKTSQIGQYWVNTNGLAPCKTYEVDVRASFDNGTTWCTDFIAPALNDPWGAVCLLNTSGCAIGGNERMAVEYPSSAVRLYPNPNQGGQMFLSLQGIEAHVGTITLDLLDTFGKRVLARSIPVSDGAVHSVVELQGVLAAGVYLAHITAGDRVHTERLVIAP